MARSKLVNNTRRKELESPYIISLKRPHDFSAPSSNLLTMFLLYRPNYVSCNIFRFDIVRLFFIFFTPIALIHHHASLLWFISSRYFLKLRLFSTPLGKNANFIWQSKENLNLWWLQLPVHWAQVEPGRKEYENPDLSFVLVSESKMADAM
jgi:hypothetical protein